MYKQKIAITINSDFDKEKLFDEFIILMSYLCRTGQIMGGVESSYFAGNEIICCQTTLEPNSLDPQYNDEWVDLWIKNIERDCNAKLSTEIIGQHIPFYKDICTCNRRDSYILFTTYLNESSPIDCGTCGRPVPIYQIKELTDRDRTDIESWKADYVSCDSLNMGCNVGERWAIKQMSDYKSQLSQFGRAICNSVVEATGLPMYYYLFNYRTISVVKDKSRKCPSCGGDWFQRKKWLDVYDFKCDNCKLVSTLSSKS